MLWVFCVGFCFHDLNCFHCIENCRNRSVNGCDQTKQVVTDYHLENELEVTLKWFYPSCLFLVRNLRHLD